MRYVLNSPLPAHAAPVLAYHTATSLPVGLHVKRRAREWVIELFPPVMSDEVKGAAVWATRATVLGLVPGALLLRSLESPSWESLASIAALMVVVPWVLWFSLFIATILAFRAVVRIEVLPAVVCMNVTGFRLEYETVIPRAQIAAAELRWFGVRLKRRDRHGGDWITFGSRAQQREICLLLGEALGVPVRGAVRKGASKGAAPTW